MRTRLASPTDRLEYFSGSASDGRHRSGVGPFDSDQWATLPSDQQEFKLSISDWLLNSTSANYLLNDRDYDAHTTLLLSVNVTHYSPGRARAMNRNPDTLQEKADRRKQRQKENKARGSSGAAPTEPSSSPGEAGSGAGSGATASGSQRPAEPALGGKAASGKGGKSSKGKGKH